MPVPRSAATTTPPATPERRRLNRKAVLTGAVELADHLGSVEALTIRKLADHLGVKPMSIYHHVPNKDEILDGMVDAVFAEIELPERDGEWQAELRRRAHSARAALARHPWATGMLDSRTNPGPATLTHHDAVIACLRASGFRPAEVSHTIATVDAYVAGFALQEAALRRDRRRSRGRPMNRGAVRGVVPQPRLVHQRVRDGTRVRLRRRVCLRP